MAGTPHEPMPPRAHILMAAASLVYGFDSTPAAVGLGGLVGLGYRVRQYSQNRRRSKNAYVRLCMTVTMSEPLPKYPIKLTPEQAAHGGLGMTPRICRAPHIT